MPISASCATWSGEAWTSSATSRERRVSAELDAIVALSRALGDPARPDRQLQAARIMGSRLASAALDLRVYGTDSARSGAGGRVSLGPGLGGGAHRTTSLATLRGAWSRPAGGAWSARLDCAR